MSTDVSTPQDRAVSDREIVEVFESTESRGLSTESIADSLELDHETAYSRLLSLAGEGVLSNERVPGWETIWWLADRPDSMTRF